MFKSLKNNNAGFSIVEIMIVLVVVGLVTTGVILAGTTLQRNSRNNARDSDVRLIAGQLRDYATNNNGALPASDDYDSLREGSTTAFANDLNLSYYNQSNNKTVLAASAEPTVGTNSYYIVNDFGTHAAAHKSRLQVTDVLPDENNIHIWAGYECPNTIAGIEGTTAGKYSAAATNWGATAATGPFASKRSFVIVYRYEGAGNDLWRCSEFLN